MTSGMLDARRVISGGFQTGAVVQAAVTVQWIGDSAPWWIWGAPKIDMQIL